MADNIFTPAPAAPKFEQHNPLETMSQFQGMLNQAQQFQQRQQLMDAQNALGELMQQHVDPQTGEIDMHTLLSKGASIPALRPIYRDLLKDSLAQALTKAQTLNSQFEAEQKRNAIMGNNAAAVLEDMARTGRKNGLADFISRNVAAGLYDGREGAKYLVQLSEAAKSGMSEESMLRRAVVHSTQAQQYIKEARLDLGTQTAQTEYIDAEGNKRIAPAYQVPGMFSPGQQRLGPQGAPQMDASGAGLAPSSEPMARQEGQPSAPPAAPSAGRLVERTPEMTQRQAYIGDTKQEHWLRKAEAAAQEDADKAVNLETTLHQQAELLKNFEQGPLMDARTWTAEKLSGLGFSKGVVDNLMGAKGKGMDAVAAAQAARKGLFEETANTLRTQLPNMSRFTNFDLQQAIKAIPTLETKKEAAEVIFGHLQNAINIAKESAKYTGNYAQWSVKNFEHKRAFKQSVLEESLRDYLKHHGLLREGKLTTKEEK